MLASNHVPNSRTTRISVPKQTKVISSRVASSFSKQKGCRRRSCTGDLVESEVFVDAISSISQNYAEMMVQDPQHKYCGMSPGYREAPHSSWGRPRRNCCGASIKNLFCQLMPRHFLWCSNIKSWVFGRHAFQIWPTSSFSVVRPCI